MHNRITPRRRQRCIYLVDDPLDDKSVFEVHTFLNAIRDTFIGVRKSPREIR
jgi:hypothetical protein